MTDWAPTWRVEVDWERDGTWTDMSTVVVDGEELGRVRDVRWARGVGNGQGGTAELVLDNRDRALEPEYSGSDYYPNVKPMRPVRISATWDGGDVAVFTGVVDGWPPTWDQSGSEANVSVSIVDAFLVLGGARLPESVWAIEMAADSPSGWWRLGESRGTAGADSSGNGHHGTWGGGATFYSRDGLVDLSADAAIEFNGDRERRLLVPGPIITGYPFTIEGLFTAPEWLGATRTFASQGAVSAHTIQVGIHASDSIGYEGKLFFFVYGANGDTRHVVSPGRYDDDARHHVVAVAESATSFLLYVDDVEVAAVDTAGSPTFPDAMAGATFAVGNIPELDPTFTTPHAGVLDEWAAYDGVALDAARVTAHHLAATAPWEGDTTGARIVKLLELAGVTTHDIDPGGSQLQATRLAARALDLIVEVADTEVAGLAGGAGFFVSRDGVPRFRDADSVYDDPRSNTVQAVFGDDWEGGDEIPYTVVEPTHSSDTVINSVEARRSGGASFTAEDQASIAEYGYRSDSLSLLLDDDLEVQDAAGLLVADRAEPRLRFRKITVAPSIDPENLWPVVLELDVGDRVSFRKRPPGGGDPVDVDAIIVGVAGRAPAGHCTIDFVLEPPPLDPFAWADDEDGSGPGLGWAEDDGTGGGAWVR